MRQPYQSVIVGSTYTGLVACGTNETGHERDIWEQIYDNGSPSKPFTANGITIGETISGTGRDDFNWLSDIATNSGPTMYQNAPGSTPLNGVIEASSGSWSVCDA